MPLSIGSAWGNDPLADRLEGFSSGRSKTSLLHERHHFSNGNLLGGFVHDLPALSPSKALNAIRTFKQRMVCSRYFSEMFWRLAISPAGSGVSLMLGHVQNQAYACICCEWIASWASSPNNL